MNGSYDVIVITAMANGIRAGDHLLDRMGAKATAAPPSEAR